MLAQVNGWTAGGNEVGVNLAGDEWSGSSNVQSGVSGDAAVIQQVLQNMSAIVI
jgi:hypothetical protein